MNNFLHKLSIATLGMILEDLRAYTEYNPTLDEEEKTRNKEEVSSILETIREKAGE